MHIAGGPHPPAVVAVLRVVASTSVGRMTRVEGQLHVHTPSGGVAASPTGWRWARAVHPTVGPFEA